MSFGELPEPVRKEMLFASDAAQRLSRQLVDSGAIRQLQEAARQATELAASPLIEQSRLAIASLSEPMLRTQARQADEIAKLMEPMLEAIRKSDAFGDQRTHAALIASNQRTARLAASLMPASPPPPPPPLAIRRSHSSPSPAELRAQADLRLASARIAELEAMLLALQARIRERELADALDDATTRPWDESDFLGSVN